MAVGDPVPGAELYIEHEPNDEPVANVETGADGSAYVSLDRGRYGVKLRLRAKVCRRLAAVDLQLVAPGLERQVAFAVDYQPGRSAATRVPFAFERRAELRLRVVEVQARHPAASALREGLVRRRQLQGEARVLRDRLIQALAAHLGPPVAIDADGAAVRWPPEPGLTTVVTFTVPTADGLLTIRVTIRCWVDGGVVYVGVGGLSASADEAVNGLAAALADSIFAALSSLGAPPAGVEILFEVLKAVGSKGGFACGGYSKL